MAMTMGGQARRPPAISALGKRDRRPSIWFTCSQVSSTARSSALLAVADVVRAAGAGGPAIGLSPRRQVVDRCRRAACRCRSCRSSPSVPSPPPHHVVGRAAEQLVVARVAVDDVLVRRCRWRSRCPRRPGSCRRRPRRRSRRLRRRRRSRRRRRARACRPGSRAGTLSPVSPRIGSPPVPPSMRSLPSPPQIVSSPPRPEDDVVAAAAHDHVGTGRAAEHVVALRADDRGRQHLEGHEAEAGVRRRLSATPPAAATARRRARMAMSGILRMAPSSVAVRATLHGAARGRPRRSDRRPRRPPCPRPRRPRARRGRRPRRASPAGGRRGCR